MEPLCLPLLHVHPEVYASHPFSKKTALLQKCTDTDDGIPSWEHTPRT